MKFAGHFILLAALLAAFTALAAGDAVDSSKPYSPIVTRNIFGLLPIPVVDPNAAAAALVDPPPKITANGIMTLFGQMQVLFKVAAKPLPGQPAKDVSYVMSIGERQDEIEVVKIDEAAGIITFNNHGTPQEVPLVAASASGPAGPGGAVGNNPGSPMKPGGPGPGGLGGGNSVMPGIGGNNGAPRANPFANNNPGASQSPAMGGMGGNTPVGGNTGAPPGVRPENVLSPEAQILMIEAQRAKWRQQGNPAHNLLPGTPMTDQQDQ